MASDDPVIILDLDAARRNFGGDETLVRDIGQIFIEDVPVLVQQLADLRTRLSAEVPQLHRGAPPQASLDTPDELGILDEAQRLAHSLKGLAGTFGAEPLGSMLAELERQPGLLAAEDSGQRLRVLDDIARHTVDELTKRLSAGA